MTFVRHYHSQKYGRSVGVVTVGATGEGEVTLTPDSSATPPQRYLFSLDDFLPLSSPEKPMEELVLRTAIARSHRTRASGKGAIPDRLLPQRTWIGDLSDAPIGEATLTYRKRLSGSDRRMGQSELMALVECGIQLGATQGIAAARCYFAQRQGAALSDPARPVQFRSAPA